jgi:hypothetical protein
MKAFTVKTGKLPNGRKLIPNHLVLCKKFNTNGEVTRLKSRLCIRGDRPGLSKIPQASILVSILSVSESELGSANGIDS